MPSDAWESVWQSLTGEQRQRLEGHWPGLIRVARECAETRPETANALVGLLRSDCWAIAAAGSATLARAMGAEGVEQPWDQARELLEECLRDGWGQYVPERGGPSQYVRQIYRSRVRRWRPRSVLSRDDDAVMGSVAAAPGRMPGVPGQDLVVDAVVIGLLEVLLGGPEHPHRGIPYWVIRMVDGGSAHDEGDAVRQFAATRGRTRLVDLAEQEGAKYTLRIRADYSQEASEAVERILERLNERLEKPVRHYIAPGPDRGDLAEGLLDAVSGETVLEDYAPDGNLVGVLQGWLNYTWKHFVRPLQVDRLRDDERVWGWRDEQR